MRDLIEESKTGRATCRICRQKIEKGELRFGELEPSPNADGTPNHRWYHLKCAAIARPHKLKPSLAAWTAPLVERPYLEAIITDTLARQKPSMPYAEPSPSGRNRCVACNEVIPTGVLRIAFEREIDVGNFVARQAGFLHPGCAAGYMGDDGFADRVLHNSRQLGEEHVAELRSALKSAAKAALGKG